MSDPAHSEAQVFSLDEQRAARDARSGLPSEPGRPRCVATTASGARCRNYAVEDGRCRVHTPTDPDREAAPARSAPRRSPGLAGGAVRPRAGGRAHPAISETRDAVAPGAPGTADGTGGADAAGAPHEARMADGTGAPTEAREPAGTASGPRTGSFAWAQAQLLQRGYGSAIDGLELLRDAADDRFLEALRGLIGFLRRRVTGAYEIDEFGFDEELTTQVLMPLLRPMHRHYWRVTSHGIEHVPEQGGALLVANHAGTLPADALITRLDVFDLTGRHARELGADLVFRTPLVGTLARKTGATLASGDDADRLLSSGELVAVWPEGFKGLGKPWKDRYKLQRFGRGGFVATASRAQVPIIPTAVVGSEEIYPMLFDLRIVARLLGFPYFPVVAQMFALPVLGPFALLPLPSKWIIEYGDPIDTASFGSDLAEDPMALFDLTDQVRERIQQMLQRNLMGRRSVFL
ncbi:MAG: lysophospholipid acyltransferase family protein [Nitriliruptoraceae bacterium]